MHSLILSLPKDEEGRRPVQKPHPEEGRWPVSKDEEPRSGVSKGDAVSWPAGGHVRR
jgi:hypothetical protein